MKKTFCDVCGKEMTEATSGKSISSDGGINITINANVAIPEPNDLCRYCVLDAIAALDDRVKDKVIES